MSEKKIWFAAKRYGWGWGPPIAWQGWVVLIVFVVLAMGGTILIAPSSPVGAIIYMLGITIALGVICWRKGETPRWRWGED